MRKRQKNHFKYIAILCIGFCLFSFACNSQPKPKVEIVAVIGSKGEEPDQFISPMSLAVGFSGNLYVGDKGNNRIQVFDSKGKLLSALKSNEFQGILGLAVDRNELIYVADLSWIVRVFDPKGNLVRKLEGPENFDLRLAEGVAVDADGYVYVSEHDGHRIQEFDPSGKFVRAWGKKGGNPGEFLEPRDISIGPDGAIYVLDAGGSRVQKFRRDGKLEATFGNPLPESMITARICGLAVSDQYIAIANGREHKVVFLDLNGKLLYETDLDGQLQYGLLRAAPTDVAWGKGNQLWILDTAGNRVFQIRVNLDGSAHRMSAASTSQ